MNILTHSQFASLLAAKKGAMILSIVSDTKPDFYKRGCPFSEIRKVEYKRVVSGAKYQDAVIRQGGEGFKAGPLPYGNFASEELTNKVIKTDSGKYQLRTQSRNPRKPIKTTWVADGEVVDYQVIKQYLKPPSESKKQAEVGVTGKKQVKPRNFDFPNILKVTYGKMEYTLIPDTRGPEQVKQVIAKKQGIRRKLEQTREVTKNLHFELMEGWDGHKDAW